MTSSKTTESNGFLLLNKKKGETSFQSLFPIKRLFGKKIGHTGTLDKFAEGLLVVLFGKATKFVPFLTELDKVYEAVITFGVETDTLDPEGQIIATASLPTKDQVISNLKAFIGPQKQIPPIYSALHVNGKRAYERALDGEELIMTPRDINIYSIEYLSGEIPNLRFKIHCSKGTYIRSIARDLGLHSGSRAYLTELTRLSVGPFNLENSIKSEATNEATTIHSIIELITILKIPTVSIVDETNFKQGKPLESLLDGLTIPLGVVAVLSNKTTFLGMIENSGKELQYRFVMP